MKVKLAPGGDKVAAVGRALDVLLAIGSARRGLSLADLANQTRVPKSTILRFLQTLERRGFVIRGEGPIFHLGPANYGLGLAYKQKLRIDDVVRPVLSRLARDCGESASLFVRQGDMRLCVVRVDGGSPVSDLVREGDLLNLRGAAGQTVVRFSQHLPSESARPVVAVSRGERTAETAGVAAPVFDSDAFVGSVGLSGSIHRFTDAKVRRFVPLVRAAAEEASGLLGGGDLWRRIAASD
jgi:DNA-binding IclR family transcriptional regulator